MDYMKIPEISILLSLGLILDERGIELRNMLEKLKKLCTKKLQTFDHSFLNIYRSKISIFRICTI